MAATAGRPGPDGMPGSRAALVAGATGGIGSALADVLVREGFGVTLTGRRADALDQLAGRLDPDRAQLHCVTADLTEPQAAARVVAEHLARFASLDTVVFAAGGGRPLRLDASRPDAWRAQIDVNLIAAADLVAASLPALRQAGASPRGSLVILVSSIVARRPLPGYAAYSATKAALTSLAAAINEEESACGVRATALCPGYVETPLTAGIRREAGESFLPAADVAEAARFLLRLSRGARVPVVEVARIGAGDGRP
jgi:short-subunit dehydrogenase